MKTNDSHEWLARHADSENECWIELKRGKTVDDNRFYYLDRPRRNMSKPVSLLTAIPASFMSAVSMTYILMADEGFHLGARAGYSAGLGTVSVL